MSGLEELEARLRDLSHGDAALRVLQEFAAGFKNTKQRQEFFNAARALIVFPPIRYDDARERRLLSEEEDAFVLLQGDVVATEAAYFLGERLVGMRFLVANSTCDLVPGRRAHAALLPVRPIRPATGDTDHQAVKKLLSELLSFKSTRRTYLPPLPGDEEDVIANAVEFDGLAQIPLHDLLVAHRVASLSLVGWRIFGAHLRGILTRAGAGEVALRSRWAGTVGARPGEET